VSDRVPTDQKVGERLAPARRLRVSIIELLLLVAAIAVSFRWPGLSVPVGLLFFLALAQRRDLLGRPTRVALALVALAIYLPPAGGLFWVPFEEWDEYLGILPFMPNFIPGTLLARMLPWFDWYRAPLFPIETDVLSTLTSLAMIVALGMLARRGIAWRIVCLTLAALMSAASTLIAWVFLHVGA